MPVPAKRVSAKRVPKKTAPPVAGNDDINAWQDRQPVLAVSDPDGEAGDYFPSGDEITTPPREEIPPQIPSPLGVKARELMQRAKEAAKPKRVAKPRVPKPRVPVDKLISLVWQGLAQAVQPINLPVARVLDMQAPVAGLVLEDTVKNTVVDRVLQPLARIEGGGEAVFAMIGPPLLVAALTRNPGAAPILVPLLRQSLMSWIEIAGPKMDEVRKREAKFTAEYGQQIDEMIGYFLSEATSATAAEPTSPNHAGDKSPSFTG